MDERDGTIREGDDEEAEAEPIRTDTEQPARIVQQPSQSAHLDPSPTGLRERGCVLDGLCRPEGACRPERGRHGHDQTHSVSLPAPSARGEQPRPPVVERDAYGRR